MKTIFDILEPYGQLENNQKKKPNINQLSFKYLGLYFTADWCSSCVRNSNYLEKILRNIEQKHPSAFHLITFRLDQTLSNFGYYQWKMPKITIRESEYLSHILEILHIPTILICNSEGKLLSRNGYKQIMHYKQDVINYWDRQND